MSYKVYKIFAGAAPDNKYKVNRHEEWKITGDVKGFSTEKEAKDYVIEQSLIHTEMVRFIHTFE